MFSKHPKMAKEFAAHTPDMKDLPLKVESKESPWMKMKTTDEDKHKGEKK